MLVGATTSAMTVLLQAESHATQLLFHAALERMTTKYPPATNGDLGKEQGVAGSTGTMQDGSHMVEAMEVVESEVTIWAASYSMAQWVGL